MAYNREEDKLIRSIDDFTLAKDILPLVKKVVQAGGGASAILKESEAAAAMQIVGEAMLAEKAEVRLKAAIEILNRTQGKPVERSVSLYADIANKEERDIDAEIRRILAETGGQEIMDAIFTEKMPPKKVTGKRGPYKKRKPKNKKVDIDKDL